MSNEIYAGIDTPGQIDFTDDATGQIDFTDDAAGQKNFVGYIRKDGSNVLTGCYRAWERHDDGGEANDPVE